MFARLVVFIGGFDFDAAEAVAGGGDVERFQVFDLLTLLVDKCLVGAVVVTTGGSTFIPGTTSQATVGAYVNAGPDYGGPITY